MSYRSVVISSLCFMTTFPVLVLILSSLLSYDKEMAFLLILVVWIAPGYVAAAIAKHHVVLHASAAGALCCFLAMLATYVFDVQGFNIKIGYSWFFASVVSFGFGALVWSFKSWAFKTDIKK